MIPGAARSGGCKKYESVAAQYLWVDKSGSSPGRTFSPGRTET